MGKPNNWMFRLKTTFKWLKSHWGIQDDLVHNTAHETQWNHQPFTGCITLCTQLCCVAHHFCWSPEMWHTSWAVFQLSPCDSTFGNPSLPPPPPLVMLNTAQPCMLSWHVYLCLCCSLSTPWLPNHINWFSPVFHGVFWLHVGSR